MNSTAAIFARLSGDSRIIAQLDVFEGEPAVFNDAAPLDFVFAEKAVLVIAAPTDDQDASTFTETIRAIAQDIRLYAKHTDSTADLDQLARDVRDLFHQRPDTLSADGAVFITAIATGPVASPTTDASLVGRRISLRLEMQRI